MALELFISRRAAREIDRIAGWWAGSAHSYKYRLAFVAHGECVLRYYNEAGKGDHGHAHGSEARYRFSTLDKLFADFERDIRRYLDEDSHA